MSQIDKDDNAVESVVPVRKSQHKRLNIQKAENARQAVLSAPSDDDQCHCSMRIKLVGDGCYICNPEFWEDMLEEEDE